MQHHITHKWSFAHAPETIWEYLTRPELVAAWLMPNDILPVVGHRFTFRTKPLPTMNFNGIVYCEILEAVPFQKLSYTWRGGPQDDQITLDSVVTWTLQPTQNGTDLLLEHSGFEETQDSPMFQAMDAGWRKNICETLDRLVAKSHSHDASRS